MAKVATCVIVSFFIIHCQCAFWGLGMYGKNTLFSINPETGEPTPVSVFPDDVVGYNLEQCVSDPVNKILYFVGHPLPDQFPAIFAVDLTTGDIISTTELPQNRGAGVYLTFIAKDQLLVIEESPDGTEKFVSMAYINTNEFVQLTTWYNPNMFSASAYLPGVFDIQNNVAWVQLPYYEKVFLGYHVYNMNVGYNILTNETLQFNNTLKDYCFAYSKGGYVVGLSQLNITLINQGNDVAGSFGLSKFNSTYPVEEELYVFPLGKWNTIAGNLAVDQSVGVDGTLYAVLAQDYKMWYWTSIDIATGNTVNATLLPTCLHPECESNLPLYSCIVYTN